MASFSNSFIPLKEFVVERWKTPFGHVSFWVYLTVAIVGAGGVGIWVECVRWLLSSKNESDGVLTAIYTYFPAIAAGSALQMLLDAQKPSEKHIRSFSIFCTALAGVFVLPYALGLIKTFPAFIFGMVGSAFSLWLWWIANGSNPSFLDIDPNDSLGSDPKSDPAGDTGGYAT
jgi:hypothetical protein